MGYVSARSFGGIGFSIESPKTVFQLDRCAHIELDGLDGIDDEGRADLSNIVGRLKVVQPSLGFRAVLKSAPPQHVGFGSKTSMSLALIAGVNALHAIGWSIEEMQRLSGRGGASGVGVHSFFHGGAIWDGGHRSDPSAQLVPSGSGLASGVPPLMLRLVFPERWRTVLVLPDEPPMSGREEVEFFAANAPIPGVEALSTMAALYHGVLPAMISADYKALATALREIHRTGFKERELRRCSAQTRAAIRALFDEGLAAGISSVGPLIYAIIPKNDDEALTRVRRACTDVSTRMVAVVQAWNSGYEVWPGNWS
jgi:beta-ribofuranosylaminobenzene 5'-phosphate synthase